MDSRLNPPFPASSRFTLAVIPDAQNYVNYQHQAAAGFPFDARDQLFGMMSYIADNAVSAGGPIAFAVGLGDTWEHPMSWDVDAEHAARGCSAVPNPVLERIIPASPREVVEIEVPTAIAAYRLLASKLPFAIVPGNHDHDHMWTDANYPPQTDARIDNGHGLGIGSLHCGSLHNWREAFGAGSDFFRDKPWYVASFRDGANSAQIFSAGGYRFLHIGLEMSPDDTVIAWAQQVLADHPGLPTIVAIHEFIDEDGERQPVNVFDLSRLDPHRNPPQALWNKLIAPHEQIILVLNGHCHGARSRSDLNAGGYPVHQMLSDYQGRKRSLVTVAPDLSIPDGIGDGWMRLLEFDLDAARPRIHVRTYSSHFGAYSTDVADYADWYGNEHPGMPSEAFCALDDFEVELDAFPQRFAGARIAQSVEL